MSRVDAAVVALRVAQIRKRMAVAGGTDVKLIAVTKTFDVSAMIAAFDGGCDGIAENYAQELIAKSPGLPAAKRLPLHFIGRLQTNKVKSIAAIVDVWQTIDRAELVNEVARRCRSSAGGAKPRIMLQVNSIGEPNKGGCNPAEVGQLLELARLKGLDVLGLMTVGPTTTDPNLVRQAFRLVRKLADDLGLAHCSMGMSGDLEIAIEEGATMIRIGSALFGPRG